MTARAFSNVIDKYHFPHSTLMHTCATAVVPREDLDDFCLAMARSIAAKPLFALMMAKQALNQTQDAQGHKQVLAIRASDSWCPLMVMATVQFWLALRPALLVLVHSCTQPLTLSPIISPPYSGE